MQLRQLFELVRERAELPSEYEAKRLTEATLRTLSEAEDEQLTSEEFCERVANRSETSMPVARRRALIVLEALAETAPEEMERMRHGLPEDYAARLEASSKRAA